MISRKYSVAACDYADDVLSGKILACKYVRQACQRFISDLDRNDIELTEEGDRWCTFLERLPHVKGKWASRRELFKLSPYQVFCVVNIYGWRWKENGHRRFRHAYIEVARKNGKTFLAAGLGLGHMCLEDEHGAEVYCGATSEKQAMEVFMPARRIVERTPGMTRRWGIEAHAKSITIPTVGSKFEPVIRNPGDGSSPSLGIVDEVHEHKTGDLIDTFITGMGARENPLLLAITTAGSDMGGPCYQMRNDVTAILSGAVKDDSIFGIIFTMDEDDDWTSQEALQKANPNLDVSVSSAFLHGERDRARRSATAQNAYKTKHLNIWVGAMEAWLNMLAYQACRRNLKLDAFKGEKCFVGLDLNTKTDIACLSILFPPSKTRSKYAAFVRHYLPEDTIMEGGNTRYKGWHTGGWLKSTPGNVTDYNEIKRDLYEIAENHEIVEIAYDPFQATQLVTEIVDDGFTCVEVGAIVKNFSEPMKELESWILKKAIHFEKDPVLQWMFGNVVAKVDAKDNIFPRKEVPANKIDGVVALLMTVNRAIAHRTKKSVYQTRGILSV